LQPSQEDEDEAQLEEDDEFEVEVLPDSKRSRPGSLVEKPTPCSIMGRVKAAPALPQLTDQALISQQSLAANLAKFKNAQAQLESAALQGKWPDWQEAACLIFVIVRC
jgi:hypothetical protein